MNFCLCFYYFPYFSLFPLIKINPLIFWEKLRISELIQKIFNILISCVKVFFFLQLYLQLTFEFTVCSSCTFYYFPPIFTSSTVWHRFQSFFNYFFENCLQLLKIHYIRNLVLEIGNLSGFSILADICTFSKVFRARFFIAKGTGSTCVKPSKT